MVLQRLSYGFICTDEHTEAVQRRPFPDEQLVIDDYREKYEATYGFAAWGLHYLPIPGIEGTACVWLPMPTASLQKPLDQTVRHDAGVQG